MTDTPARYGTDAIQDRIRTVRKQRVILDHDLACLYGVETKNLNKAFKRNRIRFPHDFVFQLKAEEFSRLRFQSGISNAGPDGERGRDMRFQIGTASRRNIRHLPYAFTEHGAIMAATVLNSPRAVEMSVFVVRAFVKMREHFATTRELARRLAEIEKQLVVHDSALVDLYEKIRPLLLPPEEPPQKPIGFSVREARARYGRAGK
jgi:hypothetical protein